VIITIQISWWMWEKFNTDLHVIPWSVLKCNYINFLLQLGWHPVAVVQYKFTHKQYTEYREWNIHNNKTIKRNKIGKCRPCPVFASYTLAFALQLGRKHEKTSVRVVEKCPDIPMAVVQYTFTHKQYTEQHNESEYTERNVHNNNT
jgi:hypothetical protein